MEDQQKSRLMLIGLAGVLLIGGGGWWVLTQNKAADKADQAANETGAHPAVTPVPVATATTPVVTPAPAAATTAATPPSNPSTTATPGIPKGLGLAGAMDPDAATTPAPATTSTPAANPIIASAAVPSVAPPIAEATPPAPTSSGSAGKYPSTKRNEAAAEAKQIAGRQDPMAGTFEKVPYPAPWTKAGSGSGRTSTDDDEDNENGAKKAEKVAAVPPPPPIAKEKPVPPPPPSSVAAEPAPALPIDNLPQPPDKPLVTPNLKLTAILGTKAVLTVPLQLRTQNKWPSVICLGPGEKFEDPTNGTFSVVSVDQDSVTIDEEGERSVKSLPQIK